MFVHVVCEWCQRLPFSSGSKVDAEAGQVLVERKRESPPTAKHADCFDEAPVRIPAGFPPCTAQAMTER
jgi:hypothetical protein